MGSERKRGRSLKSLPKAGESKKNVKERGLSMKILKLQLKNVSPILLFPRVILYRATR